MTPILKACAYACEMNIMEPAINARIQDMRIVTKPSLSEEEREFDGKEHWILNLQGVFLQKQ